MLQERVTRAAYGTSSSLKKLTQLCILKNKEFFYNMICSAADDEDDEDKDDDEVNPFSKICKFTHWDNLAHGP